MSLTLRRSAMISSWRVLTLFLQLLLCSYLRGAYTQDVCVIFMDTEIPDHAVIRLGFIRDDLNDSVHCVTNNTDCCENNQEAGWYYPNGTQLPTNESGVAFYSIKNQGEVQLNRKSGQGAPEDAGIYHCELPDTSGVTQIRYVGIYNRLSGSGQPFVNSSITFNLTSVVPPSFTLGCISTSGPPTVVTWTRDGIPVPMDGNHVLTQTLVNTVTATYYNNLTVTGIIPGMYRCTVTSIKPVVGERLSASQEVTIAAAGAPTNVLAMAASPTSIRVSWTAPISGATVTGYQINYQSEREEGSVNVDASEANITLDDRSHGLTYDITLVALSQQLPSPVVGPVIVTLNESLNSSCSIAISSFSDPECGTQWQPPASDSNLTPIVAGAVAGGVALIVIVLAVGLVVSMVKRHSTRPKEQSVKWSEVAETEETFIPTKECVAYVKTVPQQNGFDYEVPMTQCAAYETRPTDPLYENATLS